MGIPATFQLDLRFDPGGSEFNHLDFYASVVRALADISQHAFEDEVTDLIQAPVNGIAWEFKNSPPSVSYPIKTILYSIYGVFDDFNTRNHWAEASWITRMFPSIAGIGRVYMQSGGSAKELQPLLNGSESSNSSITSLPSTTGPDSNLNNNASLHLQIGYLGDKSHRYSPDKIYRGAAILLIEAAPHNNEKPAQVLTSYDSDEDFTLAVVAVDQSDPKELTWWMAREALWMFPKAMREEAPAGKWEPSVGTLERGGRVVGYALLFPGRVRGDDDDWPGLITNLKGRVTETATFADITAPADMNAVGVS